MQEKQTYQKYVKNNRVAVLYSPGYRAGWSTWNSDEGLLFDAELVQALIDVDYIKLEEIAKQKYPDAYLGGLRDLTIAWMDVGQPFYIKEYDGSESVVTSDGIDWKVA